MALFKKKLKQKDIIKPVLDIGKEKKEAKNFWSKLNSNWYLERQHQTNVIISTIKKYDSVDMYNNHQVNSIFEFGCHAGKHLYYIKQELPHIEIFGIDINEQAISVGKKKFNIPIEIGNEDFLKKIPDNSFDIVFTVSVIDHVVEPEIICNELTRIAKKYIILLEPYHQEEGKIVKMKTRPWYGIRKTFPYSYSWNYTRIFSNFDVNLLSDTSCPLGNDYSNPFYRLYEFSKI